MNQKIVKISILIVLVILIVKFYPSNKSKEEISDPKHEEKWVNNEERESEAESEGGSMISEGSSGSNQGGSKAGESEGETIGEGGIENYCTGNINFNTEINVNNEETTSDDEIVLVMSNNDDSKYENFNVYVDNTLEGTITLDSGAIASIISTEMTTWWQSLDLSQTISKNFGVRLTNETDCEVTGIVTLNYPPQQAPFD